jgi:hypothetical protein
MTTTGSDLPEPEGAGAIGRWPFGLEAEEAERPHVVVTLDTRTGAASFSGPYRTALAALCAADVEYQVDRDQGGTGELTFHVAALQEPVSADEVEPPVGGPPASAPARRDAGAWRELRPVVRVVALVTTVAGRTVRGRPRLRAGALAATAVACLPGVGHGRAGRARLPHHWHLLGREAR